MRSSALFLSVLVAFGVVALVEGQDAIRASEIGADHVGKEAAVEGRVYTSSKTDSGIHLYFGADTSTAFQALVPASALHKFRVDVMKRYTRRNVRVTGEIKEESGKRFIVVDEPSKIKVVPRRRGTS